MAARKGDFRDHLPHCHGSYGPKGRYPNKRIPLDEIGTDPTLATAFAPEGGAELSPELVCGGTPVLAARGIMAWAAAATEPPLDGIWASAPYLHNGSVPTVYHVLKSKSRPRIFTRSYRCERDDYDPVKLGLKWTRTR